MKTKQYCRIKNAFSSIAEVANQNKRLCKKLAPGLMDLAAVLEREESKQPHIKVHNLKTLSAAVHCLCDIMGAHPGTIESMVPVLRMIAKVILDEKSRLFNKYPDNKDIIRQLGAIDKILEHKAYRDA